MRTILVLLFASLLAACAVGGPDRHKLDRTLYGYQSEIRWGSLEGASGYLDPEERERLMPSTLEQQRFEQYQVSGYYVRGQEHPAADQLHQVVELKLVNRHTQVERTLVDRQRWRWDSEAKRWWLVSGLPALGAR